MSVKVKVIMNAREREQPFILQNCWQEKLHKGSRSNTWDDETLDKH